MDMGVKDKILNLSIRAGNANMLKKGDIVLGICILAIAAAVFIWLNAVKGGDSNELRKIAVIRQEDKEIKRIDIDEATEPESIMVTGEYEVTIAVEKGRIRFEKANCPDKVCVRTGWLTKVGDIAVCLPNRTIIKIEGQYREIDGISY